MDYTLCHQRPEDAALLDPLLDRTFGTDRTSKTVYRLREGVEPLEALSFAAVSAEGRLLASLRFWPVLIGGETDAILLGPLAVEPDLQGRGIGKNLVYYGLGEAKRLGHGICIVVGEPEYYGPYGFVNAPALGLALPGPVDPRRFQALELSPGALEGVRGTIGRDERPHNRGESLRVRA
jgi:predicted N-acetyltransferase YhbS